MKWVIAMMLACCTACMGSARDNAALATNTAQSVLTAVDQVWAPIVQDQIAQAKSLDDAHYQERMSSYLVVNEAIEQTRRATQLLNLAVQTWDAQADGGAMWRDVVPCVVQDIQLVRALLIPHLATAPPQLGEALRVVEAALSALAPHGICKTKRPTLTELPPPEPAPLIPATHAGAAS